MSSKTSSKKTKKQKKTSSQSSESVQSSVIEYTVKPELLDNDSLIRLTCTCLDHGFKTIFQKDFSFDEIKELTNHYDNFDALKTVFSDVKTHIDNQEQVKLTNSGDTIDLVIDFSEDDNITFTLKKIFAGPVIVKKKKDTSKNKSKIESYVKTVELLKTELSSKLNAATLDVDSVAKLQKEKNALDKKLKEREGRISELSEEIMEFKKQKQSANNKIRKKDGEIEEKDQLINDLQEEVTELREFKRLSTTPNKNLDKFTKNETLKVEKKTLQLDDIDNLKSENARLLQELNRLKTETNKYSVTQQEFKNRSIVISKPKVRKGRVPFLDGEDVLNISNVFYNIEETRMIESYLNIGYLKFALIYKASRDGDKAEIFHLRVAGSFDTLILIKTTEGRRFGGFTRETWDGVNIFKKDNEAFVFSLDSLKCYDCNPNGVAIWCYPNYGPIFGGYVIDIFDNFMSTDLNKTALRGVGYNTVQDYELNGGVENFVVEELEVYHIEPIEV